jgi:siroheme synthase-like protein
MKKITSPYYPLFLNIQEKRCVVVGGGEVAWRKVCALLDRGAIVEVISPEICGEIRGLGDAGQVKVSRRDYRQGDLKGAILAIAATDDHKVNLSVAAEARRIKVLVNVVDNADKSDFITPSTLQRGDICIAISTSGKSPALSRKIRTKIEEELGEDYSSLAGLIEEARIEIRRQGVRVNGETWQKALELDRLISLMKNGRRQEARDLLLANLKSQSQ